PALLLKLFRPAFLRPLPGPPVMESPEPKPAVDLCNRDRRSNQQSNKSCTWRMASHNRHGARPAWSSRQRCCPTSAPHAGAGCSDEAQCVAFYDYSRAALMECNPCVAPGFLTEQQDRKSTRLNSSHVAISYAVFCLKKKKRRYRQISFNIQ